MAYETVLYEVADQIATITLNRPAKMNSYTPQMGYEISESIMEAEGDPNVRVIIMTGRAIAHSAPGPILAVSPKTSTLARVADAANFPAVAPSRCRRCRP